MNNCCNDIYPEMDLTRWESCCSTQLANAENYYTKGEVDNIVDELVISGGGVTSGEVQTMINNAVATKADKSEIPVVPTKVSAFENDVPYLTQHQDLNAYATKQWVEGFTYDKATIDEKVAGGGSFDPSQYYTKNDVNQLISGFAESSAVTIEISAATSGLASTSAVTQMLDGYATEEWCDNKFLTMGDLGDFATKLWVENQGYLKSADLSNYALKSDLSGKADTSAVTVINTTLSAHTGDSSIHVTQTEKNTWNSKVDSTELNNYMLKNQIWCGTIAQYNAIPIKDAETLYLIYE